MKKLSTYFRTILCIAFLFFMQSEMLNACNNSDFAIDSQTDNPDGTTTYCLTLTVELGGLDASFYGFVVQFNSASNTPVVTSYPSTLSTADLIFGNLGDNLTGVTGSDINSIANDFSDWDQYLNQVNTLSYEWGGFTGAASDDISLSICITVDGCVEEILFDASVNSGSSSCEFTESTGISCSTPPPCNALPGDVIVSGATANGTNTYDIADGASIDLNDDGAGMTPPPADGSFPAGFGIALFDCDPTGVPNCDLNDPVTFGNSSLCPCFLGIDLFPTGDSNSGGESSSIPGNSTLWVMHITLDYIDNGPPVELHPDLDGDGCFESGPLVTLNYLPPEPCDCTNPVCGGMHWDCSSEAEADYNDPSSTATEYSFASPLPFTNGTSYTLCYEYTTGASETEVGFVNAVQYLDFFCDFDRVYHVYESTCGAEISSSGPADFGNDGLEYSVSSNTAYTFCVEVTSTTNDCQTLDDTYVWLYDASGGSSGCGTCSAPCTDSGMGSVDTYDDRTYSDCWTPECSILGPTSITNCFEVMTDATGFVGVVLGGGMGSTPADPFAICFATDFDPTWTLSDGCGATIPNPTPNVNGHSIGFNPEYTGLTPNNAYVLCVTVEIPAGCQMDSDNFSHELCMDYYGTDCTANLEGTSEDGFSCKDDGIELATTINWIQTAFDAGPNADGTETTGFLVFCDPPVLPMTQTYAQANSLAAILEADDSIGDLIDNNGDYVDPFTGEVCSDEIYLVPITISQIVGGSFIVDWDCFDTDDIVQVDLGLTPMADATANPSTICAGESSELTATGGGTYEWSNGLGTNPVVTVTPTTTTTYTVTVTDVSGNCTDTAQVTVTVNDPGPEPSTECWETATLNNTTCMWDVTGTQPTEPTTECYETATFNDGTCVWDVTGTQPTEPTTACYETATFNDVTCIWDVTGTQPTEPTTECYETATFNDGTCVWDVTGTQPTEPTSACYETATFNDVTCIWDVTGTQPTQPTTECYETATFNDVTCVWDVTGTQPTEPTTECYETATFNDGACVWDVTGTQPTEPTSACYETATFNDVTCIWDVTGTQPTEPTTECYETATFNDGTCVWDVTGTQPTEPTSACYETATFNDVTCIWDVTGTQPTEPTTECYETATFNDGTCVWDVTGTQPTEPTTECYETATFNDVTCIWDVTGTQPTEPATACYETATFNDVTCIWDVTGTQPTEPTTECYETATFNDVTCIWDVTGTQPTEPTTECYETATFNNGTCMWDVTGTQPTEPTTECYETATFNDVMCIWVVTGIEPTEPTTECYETATFNDVTCVWDVTGTQPTEPTGLECWETTSFNDATCVWDVTGTQPTEPTTECYETATFNDGTCIWDVIGTQPTEPTTECWETATFNDITCVWDVSGTQPTEPTTECWETATFNDGTCMWVVTGTQPTEPTTECYETAIFNDVTCIWDVTGTQPTEPTGLDCWETTTFNDATCVWDVTGSQPTEPTTECYETATFNDGTCIWDVTGTQPTEPTTECWETAMFNDVTCVWDVTGTQPTEPTTECWETATFNNATCIWVVTGTQPTEPTSACYEIATFNDVTCVWDVTGTQPTEPTTECWESTSFNDVTCIWDVTGSQPTEPTTECWETASFNNTLCIWEVSGNQPMEPSVECWETTSFNNITCIWDVSGTQPAAPIFTLVNTYCVGDTPETLPNMSDNGVSGTWNPIAISTTNPGTINYIFTPADGCTDVFEIMITINDCGCMDPAFVSIDPIVGICENENIDLTAILSGSATSLTWSTSGDGAFDNVTSINPTYTPGSNDIAAGNVTLSIITDDPDGAGPCAPASASTILTINTFEDPNFNIQNDYCGGDLVDMLPLMSNNGITGSWIPSTIDNMTSGAYIFTSDAGQCANDFTLNVIITPSNTPTFSITNTYCVDDAPDMLSTTSDNGVAGIWTPTSINTASAGTTNYLFTPTNSCDEALSLSVTVTDCGCLDPAFVTIDPINEICEDETLSINAVIAGSATSVTWSATGDGTFDNASAVNSIYTPGASDIANGVVTLSVMTDDPDGTGPCSAASTSILLVINNLSDPTFNLMSTYCAGDVVEILPATSNNSVAGTWSPSVIDDMNSGDYLFTPDAGQCANDFTLNVTITPSNTPTFSITNTYCVGDAADVLTTTSDNGVEGTWNPMNINTSSAGTANYFFTPTNSCDESFSISVTVTDCGCLDPAFVTIDPINEICANETLILNAMISGSATSITWSSAGDGAFDNATSTNPIYTPGAADITNGVVTLSVITDDPDGVDPCSAASTSILLVINNLSDPTFNLMSTYCAGDVVEILPTTSNNSVVGTWSPSVIDDMNSGEYLFTPDAEQCANDFTLNVIITPSNTPTFLITNTYCVGDASDVLSTTSDNGVEGTWNPMNINTSSAGTANYFFTPTNSCDESFSISVTVTDCGCLDPAFVTIDPINEICPNETLILNAMISGSATSVTWSSAGDGAFDNTTSTNPIYTPGAADITNGVVTLSVMTDDPDGVDPCSAASTSILLVINNFSDPTFNLMSTYCAGDVVEILPTTSNNSVVGTWSPSVIDDMNSGDYLFTSAAGQCANDFTLNVIITPSNTPTFSITNAYCVGDVTDVLSTTSDNGVEGTWTPAVIDATSSGATDYFFTPTNSCDETISISVSVMDCNCVDPAFVTIDPIGSICENQSIDLNAVISGSASSVTWTSTGDGTFDNTISLTPIYTPGPSDIIDGIVSLTVTTDDPDGADDCSAAASNISLNINELVDPIFMISDTFCIGTMVDVLSSTSDNGVNGSWSPSVIDNALSGTYVFTPNTNECANPYSISIIIDPCTTSECDLVLTTNVIDESCFGLNDGSVELMVTNGVEPITYTWNNNNLEGPNFDGLSPGTYTVNYNDAMGCTGLFTFEILEGSILTLEVTSDETLVPLNTEVNLTGSTNIPDDRIAQINWNISQGLDCQDCLETTAQILSSANYILTIVDVDGCTIQDSVLVDVIKIDPEIYFPNVFSPNGDADNQYFYPKGKNVEIISSLRIYDRWGNLIFENENFEPNDNSQGWDGTYQSKPLNPGVFVYIASYKGIAGFEGTMSGDITIIR